MYVNRTDSAYQNDKLKDVIQCSFHSQSTNFSSFFLLILGLPVYTPNAKVQVCILKV